ncbi:MAG TPA: VOC family protein [Chthoniobacterales bacterium]|nr:VOC family protein [Chthoniobacterales bacterium]
MHQPLAKTIDYIEMPSRDPSQTRQFFTQLFGWSFEDYGPDYIAFDDGRMTGGFFRAENAWQDAASCPLVVFYASDLPATQDEVKRLGGRITRDIFEFPGGFRFHFQAPGSGEFAVWCEKK